MKYTAKVNEQGDIYWYKTGTKIQHRENDLPAVEHANGGKEWWMNGQRHRDSDLPAIEWVCGYKSWFVNGQRHRDNGLPAVDYANGDKEWWVNDQRHRNNGLPAIEYMNGGKEWWVNGIQIDEPKACKTKSVVIDGVEYELIRK